MAVNAMVSPKGAFGLNPDHALLRHRLGALISHRGTEIKCAKGREKITLSRSSRPTIYEGETKNISDLERAIEEKNDEIAEWKEKVEEWKQKYEDLDQLLAQIYG